MRVAVLNITNGNLSGGYKKYLHYLLPKIAKNPQVTSILLGLPKAALYNFKNDITNISLLELSSKNLFVTTIDDGSRKRIEAFKPDVIFIPTARWWKIKNIPTVTMVRNMEPLAKSNMNPIREKIINWLRAKEARKSALKSDRVIAVSNFVREFMIKYWNTSPEKIGLVYHGVEKQERQKLEKPENIPDALSNKFLFTAGSIRPARGIEDILFAIKYLPDTLQISGLVIAGETNSDMLKYQNQLKDWIQKNSLSSRVHWAGKLNEREITWCYKNCSAFIMTSRVEACPNIALEAMANGCICISTNTPPMPEFFKDWAFYYPSGDGQALSQAIKLALGIDNYKKSELSEGAKRRASEFSWDICAEKTVSELEKAIEDFRMNAHEPQAHKGT